MDKCKNNVLGCLSPVATPPPLWSARVHSDKLIYIFIRYVFIMTASIIFRISIAWSFTADVIYVEMSILME